MESITYLQNVKISPKKLRFFLHEMKKKDPQDVLNMLDYTPGAASKVWYRSIQSALNNAQQTLKTSIDLLKFKSLAVDEGFTLKRFRPGGRGGVEPFKRRLSHIRIVIETKDSKSKVSPVKKELTVEKKSKVQKVVKSKINK